MTAVLTLSSPARTALSEVPQPGPLRFWHGLDGAAAAWLAGVAQRATAAGGPDVEVQAEVDVEAALFRQDEEASVPDVVLVASNLVGLAAELGLSPVPAAALTGVAPRFQASVRRGAAAYGVPLFSSDTLLFYRNTALAKAAPRSLAAALAEASGRLAWPLPIPFFFVPVLAACGAWQPQAGGDDFRFPAPAFSAALSVLRQLSAATGQAPDCAISCATARFVRGEAAYLVGLGADRQAARARLGARLAVSVLPPLAEGQARMRPLAGTYALVFPNRALAGPRGPELRRFAARFLRGDEQGRLFAETGRLPVGPRALAAAEAGAAGDDRVLVEALRAAAPLPNGRAVSALWPTLRKVLRAELTAPLPAPAETLTRLLAEALTRFTWEPVAAP